MVFLYFGGLSAFVTRDRLNRGVRPSSLSSPSSSRARFLAASFLGAAFLAVTLTAAADFDVSGTVTLCFLPLLIGFAPAYSVAVRQLRDNKIREFNPGGSFCNDVRILLL